MTLTRADRAALPDEAFAVPAKRLLPINDQKHVAMARNQVGVVKGLNESERAEARLRIRAQAERLGMDTSGWDTIKTMRLEAMAIEMPDGSDHPNRMPFSGVLVRLDEVSCSAPHGSKGKKIVMSASAAEAALGSLLGMAVDFTPDFDGHDAQRKFGVITAANIEGSDLRVEGFIYAADFPTEAATVKTRKESMGFSFEAQRILVENFDADPLVITDCVFTGAAILLKDKAAFTTTSLAASAAGDIEMTKEELEAILAAALKPVTDEMAALKEGQTALDAKVEAAQAAAVRPSDEEIATATDVLKRAGVKISASTETVDNGAAIAAAVEAATKPLLEKVGTLETQLKDGIAASRDTSKEPERKTVSPQITQLLAKAGVDAPGEGKKLDTAALDKILASAAPDVATRLRVKAGLSQAGLID